jgi:hypothetical protein
MSNPKDVLVMIGYFAALALAVYVSRELANLCRVILESIIGKPTLVRETTKKNIVGEAWDWLKETVKGKRSNKQQNEEAQRVFDDVVLPAGLKARVISLACSAAKARDYDAPHRHVLLYVRGEVCSCFRCRPTPTFRESRPPSSPLSFARFAREGTAPPARARPWWPRSLRSASAWTTPCAPAATSAPSGRTA